MNDLDPVFYLNYYKDLSNIKSNKEALDHWQNIGLNEGRIPNEEYFNKLLFSFEEFENNINTETKYKDVINFLIKNKIYKNNFLISNNFKGILKIINDNSILNPQISNEKHLYNNENIEHINNIPKIAFTYWDMSNLSFLHYLTLYTFKKYNNDFKVILYYPKRRILANTWTSNENKSKYNNISYIPFLKKLDIHIVEIDFENDIPEIPFYLPEVIKSDFFRLYICKQIGGVWFDMDTFWINSIKNTFYCNEYDYYKDLELLNNYYNKNNYKNNDNKNKIYDFSYFVMCSSQQNNKKMNYPHFCQYILMHNKKSKLINLLYNECKNNLNCDMYESIGTPMFSKLLSKYFLEDNDFNYSKTIFNINIFAPYKWYEMNELFENKNLFDLTKSACIHWFNGSDISKKFISTFNHTNFENIKDNSFKEIFNKYLNDKDKFFLKNLEFKKISIILAYYNRKNQFIQTLESIKKSNYKNKEIVIIDDNSFPEQRVNTFINEIKEDLDIKVITIEENEKKWVNPCIPYNIGFKEATGDIIIIQNPEVMHVGDCLSFVNENLKKGDWLSFNCYGSPNFNFNNKIKGMNNNEIFNLININSQRIGGNSVERDDVGGWLNHYEKHFVAYHYLAAIHKDDLFEKMNGGFNEIFKDGIGCDDDEFIKRLIYNNFNFKTTKFINNKPFAVHLFHDKPEILRKLDYKENRKIFDECCKKMNFQPINNIAVAPEKEKPLYFQKLIY